MLVRAGPLAALLLLGAFAAAPSEAYLRPVGTTPRASRVSQSISQWGEGSERPTRTMHWFACCWLGGVLERPVLHACTSSDGPDATPMHVIYMRALYRPNATTHAACPGPPLHEEGAPGTYVSSHPSFRGLHSIRRHLLAHPA